jgi:hypothetical protein
MNLAEYEIVTRVMGDTLPYRIRILITNGAGVDGRAFTIPTSLISTIVGMPATGFLGGVALGYLASAINLAYLINVGDDYGKLSGTRQDLLVHETMHVWQGKNSNFALSYVYNSIYNQCVVGNAYDYKSKIGDNWDTFNVEQQAQIVEEWFSKGEKESDVLFPYIRDYVRKGVA